MTALKKAKMPYPSGPRARVLMTPVNTPRIRAIISEPYSDSVWCTLTFANSFLIAQNADVKIVFLSMNINLNVIREHPVS